METSPNLKVFGEAFVHDASASKEPLRHPPVETWSWTPHDPAGAQASGECPPYEHSIETNYRPSAERQDVVLVFPLGWTTRSLLREFEALDIAYFYLDFDEFTAQGTVDIEVSGAHVLRVGDAAVDLRDVAAVVWAAPDHMFAEPTEGIASFLYIHRWRQLLRDLRGLLREGALWLPSHPLNGSPEWQNKLSELSLARREGLAVPDTLFFAGDSNIYRVDHMFADDCSVTSLLTGYPYSGVRLGAQPRLNDVSSMAVTRSLDLVLGDANEDSLYLLRY